MRCGVLEYLVIRIWQQIVSGVLQSKQAPVLQQGVLRLKRCALIGAASFLARDMAESTSRVTLFIPMIINTFRGPAAIEDTGWNVRRY